MARILDFGVNGTGGEILHPKHKNRWEVKFLFGGGENALPLTLQAITVDRPKLEFEEIVLDRYNSRAYIAGKHVWQPMNITFEDDLGGQVTRVIHDQLEKQQHIIGESRSATLGAAASGDQYKFAVTLNMLDGDYTGRNIKESWNLEGAWLQNVDYTDLDYSASETIKITCVIRFDHAWQQNQATGTPLATWGSNPGS